MADASSSADAAVESAIKGEYPYHYFHFRTRIGQDGEQGVHTSENGERIQMKIDRSAALGNWWHSFMDEMFTEAAQRGAAYRGSNQDWMERHSPNAIVVRPVVGEQMESLLLFTSADVNANPDPESQADRPAYRGGVGLPIRMTQSDDPQNPARGTDLNQNDLKERTERAGILHEMAMQTFRGKMRYDREDGRRSERLEHDQKVADARAELAAMEGSSDARSERVSLCDGDGDAIMCSPEGRRAMAEAYVAFLVRQNEAIVLQEEGRADRNVRPVGSAAFPPWLMLHPQQRSPTFKWFLRTVGGVLGSNAVVTHSVSDVNAHHAVDLREVVPRKGAATLDAAAPPAAIDGQKAPAPAAAAASGKKKQKKIKPQFDPASWDAPYMRATWRVAALLYDLGLRMRWMQRYRNPGTRPKGECTVQCYPFFDGTDAQGALTSPLPSYVAKGPNVSGDCEKSHPLLVRFLSGVPLTSTEFPEERRRAEAAQVAKGGPTCVTLLAKPKKEEPTLGYEKYVESQRSACKAGWQLMSFNDKNVPEGCSNIAYALRTECARLIDLLSLEHVSDADMMDNEKRAKHIRDLMTLSEAMGNDHPDVYAVDEDDHMYTWLQTVIPNNLAFQRGRVRIWAVRRLREFITRGVKHAMNATTVLAADDTVRYSAMAGLQAQDELDEDTKAALAVCGLANKSKQEFPAQEDGNGYKIQSATMTAYRPRAQPPMATPSLVKRAKNYANEVSACPLTQQVDAAIRSEFAVMKEICKLLCSRSGMKNNGMTESPPWTAMHMNEAAQAAANKGEEPNPKPQSVFDKEEETYLRTMRQMTDTDLIALERFADFSASVSALTEPSKVHARRLLRRFFGTDGPNGPRRWPWLLNKVSGNHSNDDGLVRYDDGSVQHQTGPAQFSDPERWKYPDGLTQAERNKFIKDYRLRGIQLCNSWGSMNTYRPVLGELDSNSRWTLPGADGNLMEWQWDPTQPDTTEQEGLRILTGIAHRNKRIHNARLAWAQETVKQHTSQDGTKINLHGLLTAFPPPTFNGVQLYVKGYDYVGALPAEALQEAVMDASAAISDNTFQDAEVTAVAKEAMAALATKGMYPRLAFAFKAQPAVLGSSHVREYVRLKKVSEELSTTAEIRQSALTATRTQERMLRINSFAYLVFAKQRECEMQQVYTSHNIALTKQRYRLDRGGWVEVVSAYGPGTRDIQNVRKPLMIRQRYSEWQSRQKSATIALDALRDEYNTDNDRRPATVDTADTAFMMLDAPFGALREMGREYIEANNAPNGTNPDLYTDSDVLGFGKAAMLGRIAPPDVLSSCDMAAWGGTATNDVAFNNELTLAWIRKPVLLRDPNAALPPGVAELPAYDDRYAFSPSRYQHPAILCLPEMWTVQASGRHIRNPAQKLHYDHSYLRKAYYDFMHDLKHILEVFKEDEADTFATSHYSGSGYESTNALLRLNDVMRKSYSALGKRWASHRIEKLFKANVNVDRLYVEPYRDTDRESSCRVYELAYHLYENPVGVGRDEPGNAERNPYATTLPQWMANHMQLTNQLAGIWEENGVDTATGSPKKLVEDATTRGLAIEQMGTWDATNTTAYATSFMDAWKKDADQLAAQKTPMYLSSAQANGNLTPLFTVHNLHKMFYSAPRLQREIQVCRGEKFDFLCDAPETNANAKGAPFQAGTIKIGQRFITQSIVSTSVHDPYQYMYSSNGAYHQPGLAPGNANSGFWFPSGNNAYNKSAGCCLHLMTIAKGTPILPLYLCEEWDNPAAAPADLSEIGGPEVSNEAEIMLPPNCEFEFLGMVRVPRFHEDDKFKDDANRAAAMKETVSAFCWFVRWRGAPRGGFLPGQPGGIVQAPPDLASAQVSGEVAMSKADAAPEKDAGYYTDDEDLDWGVGGAADAQRAHLHPSLSQLKTPTVNMAGLVAASSTTSQPGGIFGNVPWPWKSDVPAQAA